MDCFLANMMIRSLGLMTLSPEGIMTLAAMEKKYILEVLEASGGNKSKTTELLGISRAALWRKLKQFKEDKHRATPVNTGKQAKKR